MENILTTDSVFDRLVKVLDTNCGYVDEEKAEKVAKRIMRSGLVREEKPQKWEFLFNALDGTPRYGCPICKELEWRKTNFCPNCGADMMETDDEKA
jgi:rubrerythrin